MADEQYTIPYVEKKRETQKAVCLQFDDDGVPLEVWFPLSQCTIDETKSVVHATEWILTEKEMMHLAGNKRELNARELPNGMATMADLVRAVSRVATELKGIKNKMKE